MWYDPEVIYLRPAVGLSKTLWKKSDAKLRRKIMSANINKIMPPFYPKYITEIGIYFLAAGLVLALKKKLSSMHLVILLVGR